MRNRITILREIGPHLIRGVANYDETQDGWVCYVTYNRDEKVHDRRGPVNDAYSELEDMVSLASSNLLDGIVK